MNMYDTDRSGALGFREWEALLAQLGAWRAWFASADADRSGKLSFQELSAGLRAFGYQLSHATLTGLFRAFDADCSGSVSFDEFIQCLVELHMLTKKFRQMDPASTGSATLDYAGFL